MYSEMGYDPGADQRRADPELGGIKPETPEQAEYATFRAAIEAMPTDEVDHDSVWALAMKTFPEANGAKMLQHIADVAEEIEFGPMALKAKAEKIRQSFKGR